MEKGSGGFMGCLVRRKKVDVANNNKADGFQLAKRLSVIDLIAIGNLFDFCCV